MPGMEVRMRHACLVLLLSGVAAASASAQGLLPPAVSAQNVIPPPPAPRTVNLSGPRFGVTALSDGVRAELASRGLAAPSMISQFGWQLEKAFYTRNSGVAAVSEWVLLLGGLERDLAIPSLTWLVGMRTAGGAEFGLGPNISPAGTGLAIAAGVTLRHGFLNVPVNVAVVPSKSGTRVSFLTGFNMRR
jgi:hypothetical protein